MTADPKIEALEQDEDEDEDDVPVPAPVTSHVGAADDAADFLEVLMLLRSALGDARGRLLVAEAQRLGGLRRRSRYRTSLIARVLRHLGWARMRYRFNGKLRYAYAKGTRLQRETVLVVARDENDRLVVREEE